MRISEAFPSKYLRAADLMGRPVTAVMERMTIEEVGDDTKPIVYFVGKTKGLALNKTNATKIALAYGDDTDDWMGRDLILYPTEVDFQGRQVEAIRVKVPTQARQPRESVRQRVREIEDEISLPAAVTPQRGNGNNVPRQPLHTEMNDDVPF
jgi:hypothetical protein